jgi:hypothetical protein
MSNAFGPLAAVGVTTSTGTVNLAGPLVAAGVTTSTGMVNLAEGRTTSGWSESATATTLALVPGRERRALVHIPREEWTAVRMQVLCLRVMTGFVVGVVLDRSFVPLWLAGDPEALPTLLGVVWAWGEVDAWLRRRLP